MIYTISVFTEQLGTSLMRVTKLILVHGTSFGTALAMAISFNVNHSVLWAIIHGIFSWFYVVYYALLTG